MVCGCGFVCGFVVVGLFWGLVCVVFFVGNFYHQQRAAAICAPAPNGNRSAAACRALGDNVLSTPRKRERTVVCRLLSHLAPPCIVCQPLDHLAGAVPRLPCWRRPLSTPSPSGRPPPPLCNLVAPPFPPHLSMHPSRPQFSSLPLTARGARPLACHAGRNGSGHRAGTESPTGPCSTSPAPPFASHPRTAAHTGRASSDGRRLIASPHRSSALAPRPPHPSPSALR